jgi:hypothetical protein
MPQLSDASFFTAITDEHGLPWVRFVFVGYRVTNRRRGPSNWGGVSDPWNQRDATAHLRTAGCDGNRAQWARHRLLSVRYQPAIPSRLGGAA